MIIEDCRQRHDWPKWKYAKKHNCLLNERFLDLYFAHLKVWNPLGTYGFLRKNQIKNDEIVRYKSQLVAQGCSQKPCIDLWKNIFTSIGCNNIAILDYPRRTTRFAFTSNGWCYNLFVRFFWESYLYEKSLKDFICPTRQILKRVIQ